MPRSYGGSARLERCARSELRGATPPHPPVLLCPRRERIGTACACMPCSMCQLCFGLCVAPAGGHVAAGGQQQPERAVREPHEAGRGPRPPVAQRIACCTAPLPPLPSSPARLSSVPPSALAFGHASPRTQCRRPSERACARRAGIVGARQADRAGPGRRRSGCAPCNLPAFLDVLSVFRVHVAQLTHLLARCCWPLLLLLPVIIRCSCSMAIASPSAVGGCCRSELVKARSTRNSRPSSPLFRAPPLVCGGDASATLPPVIRCVDTGAPEN